MILDKIGMPCDLKKLSIDEMRLLASEIRELIIKKVNTIGGHMAPNLGIVETTIAMHYVFNSPIDSRKQMTSQDCHTQFIRGVKDFSANSYSGIKQARESCKHLIYID